MEIVPEVLMSLASMRLLINLILTLNFSILKRNGDLGFYDCFMIGGFMDSVIQSATERTDFKGLYFQRHLESIHFLEKLS